MNTWKSFHIFIRDMKWQEMIIIQISEFFQKNNDYKKIKLFFIRYWEGGPHLRIRFSSFDKEVETEFKERINQLLLDYPGKNLEKVKYYHSIDLDLEGFSLTPETLPWFEEKSIQEIT
ncbi:MAG: hypothetical protein IC227_03630 [Enterococcus lacertideformus]|uniref:Thiopeptide-type bacteriocin biosynthesis domain-containing protein n=1 Tax=Enterococcus lacertideformus TaxID=2771493 RepID=A0A931F9F8_9ENTE|nr:hypothetical protein [Enterococcus lacertideformus]